MDLALYTLKAAAYAIVDPTFAFLLLVLAIILYFQNRKTAMMQRMIIGESVNSPLELTISQVVLGIFGGVIGSMILTYSGVIFDYNSGITMLFMLSILLMLIKPRFICFSYSGAILGLAGVLFYDIPKYYGNAPIFGELFKVDITTLMTLVGVLHIVEGLLVTVDGSRGAIPVFTNKEGRIAGGFALKRYWPIPIVLMLLSSKITGAPTDSISTPNWWPIINSPYTSKFLETAMIAAAPLYAILGHSSVTFTRNKKNKAFSSGIGILTYGIVLSFAAQLAVFGIIPKLLIIIFAPLAHEVMLRVQNIMEIRGQFKYISGDDGIAILEVAPNSPAAEMGIKSGDKLLEINSKKIINESDILDSIKEALNHIVVKIKNSEGKERELNYSKFSGNKRLGVVFVPRNVPKESVVLGYDNTNFKDVYDKLKDDDDKDK